MDARVFDHLTRQLGSQMPRRTLGGLLAVILAMVGLPSSVSAKRRRKGGRREQRQHGQQDRRQRSQPHKAERVHDEKKKKRKKKKKKATPQSPPPPGNASPPPPQSPPPPGGGGAQGDCPSELKACAGGCIPTGTPCCPAGKRPCDGACISGPGACAAEFAQCMAPVTADWYAAIDACDEACVDVESAPCRSCIAGMLETFADPLVDCLRVTSGDFSAEAAPQRLAAVAAPKPCDIAERRRCRVLALTSDTGQAAYGTLVGALDGPIGALAGFLPNMGQLYIDLRDCETQYGCPGQQCSTAVGGNTGVCCGYCDGYDPNAHVCKNNCAEDESCRPDLGQCRKNCKGCGDYLVGGTRAPCGQITNNCDQVITCNGCRQGQRCVDRRCVDCASQRSAKGRQALADDECCLPQTCAELGVACGSPDDGCGGTLQCECPDGQVCTSGACQCQPRTCADVGVACGSLQDGCGGTIDCGCVNGATCRNGRCCPEPCSVASPFQQEFCCSVPGTCCPVLPVGHSNVVFICCPSGEKCLFRGGAAAICLPEDQVP